MAIVRAVRVGMLLVVGAAIAAADGLSAPLPDGAKPLSAAETKAFFAGKTENFNSGAKVFYAPDGKIVYWSANAISTQGKWTISDAGRLCYDATFTSKSDFLFGAPGTIVTTCWDHYQVAGTIYEIDSRDGSKVVDLKSSDWYFFQRPKVDPSDAVNKMTAGDTVSSKVQELMSAWRAPPPDPAQYGKKLGGPEIQAAVFGHLIVPDVGSNTIRVEGSGAATIVRTTGNNTTGTVRVVGDQYCQRIPVTDVDRCFTIRQTGTKYALIFPDGSLNITFTLK